MKRELIFRAWSKDDREWITEWSSMNGIDKDVCKYKGKHVFFFDYDDDQVSIMQYTGLKDKNGKEIYEGDIVIAKGDVSVLYLVKFGQYMYSDACFFLEEISDTNPPLRFFSRGIDQTEIIGNIHENPELLESAS